MEVFADKLIRFLYYQKVYLLIVDLLVSPSGIPANTCKNADIFKPVRVAIVGNDSLSAFLKPCQNAEIFRGLFDNYFSSLRCMKFP